MTVRGYQVIPARPEDVAALLAFNERRDGAPRWRREIWEALVSPRAGSVKRAVVLQVRDSQGELCGWLAGTQVGQVAELEFLFIDAAERRRGLARLLLQHWMNDAKAQGAAEMLLEVRASNRGALELYRATGFLEQGRRKAYYTHPVEDAMLMRCTLSRLS